mgnify:CR=1 FL=1
MSKFLLTTDSEATLAVPVFEGPRVVATIGMTWIASTFNNEQAVERYLEPLQTLSKQVSERLAAL